METCVLFYAELLNMFIGTRSVQQRL